MMKPSLFVGSSTEALGLANYVKDALQHVTEVTVWNQGVFQLGGTALDSLLAQSRFHDYAIFVLAKDDLLLLRNSPYAVTRDNVIFELGIFTATLGSKRCFFLIPSGDNFRIPSDLHGVTFACYDLTSHDGNVQSAIEESCSEIIAAIENRNALSGEWLLYIEDSLRGTMYLTSAGDRAVAKLSYTNADGTYANRDFKYEGRYIGGQFVLSFEQNKAEDLIVGAMVLRASSDQTKLIGSTTYWHHDLAEMVTVPFVLIRGSRIHSNCYDTTINNKQ